MLSIQTAGVEILEGTPRSFYIMCGTEYGVKNKYISSLQKLYSTTVYVDDLKQLLKTFHRRSLIDNNSCLYVSRYDTDFLRSVDKEYAKYVLNTSIRGCLVLVYNSKSEFDKLNKYFPDNTLIIDDIPDITKIKYLRQDYPELDDRYISLVTPLCGSYGQAYVACGQLNSIRTKLHAIEDNDILYTLGLYKPVTEQQMMIHVAAKDVTGVMNIVDDFDGDVSVLMNGMCHVALELDKAMDNKRTTDSPYCQYIKYWTREDVYNFFDQCYTQTIRLRSALSGTAYTCLMYLASLLSYKKIPSVSEVR